MTLTALADDEREVVRRSMEAGLQYFNWDFQTRLGITRNAMLDLLHGVKISDQESQELTGASCAEMVRVYRKWAEKRGWSSTGLR